MSSTHHGSGDEDRGSYVEHQGRPAVRFRRRYLHPADRVWTAITDPGELSHWFPATVRMDARPGGSIDFTGIPGMPLMTGTILLYEPPLRLAYTWGNSELHFRIDPLDEHACVLTLTEVLEAKDTAARNSAGWEVCLAELGKLLAGLQADGPHSATAEDWQQHYDFYLAAGVPAGAPLPGK